MEINCPNCQLIITDYEIAMLNNITGYEFNCSRCKTIILIPDNEIRMTVSKSNTGEGEEIKNRISKSEIDFALKVLSRFSWNFKIEKDGKEIAWEDAFRIAMDKTIEQLKNGEDIQEGRIGGRQTECPYCKSEDLFECDDCYCQHCRNCDKYWGSDE